MMLSTQPTLLARGRKLGTRRRSRTWCCAGTGHVEESFSTHRLFLARLISRSTTTADSRIGASDDFAEHAAARSAFLGPRPPPTPPPPSPTFLLPRLGSVSHFLLSLTDVLQFCTWKGSQGTMTGKCMDRPAYHGVVPCWRPQEQPR